MENERECLLQYLLWRVKRSALRLRFTGSVVQSRVSDDLLSYKAIDSKNFRLWLLRCYLPQRYWLKQELRHTSPFLKAVVGNSLLISALLVPTIQSRRGHQLWRV